MKRKKLQTYIVFYPLKKNNNYKKSPHFNNIRISFFTHSVHFKVTGYSSFQN